VGYLNKRGGVSNIKKRKRSLETKMEGTLTNRERENVSYLLESSSKED